MKICMYGFSGQNMNLWLKFFRDHTDAEVTLFTPSFSPSARYSFPRLKVYEIAPSNNRCRLYTMLYHRYSRIRSLLHLLFNKFDLVIMQGLYNRSFAPWMFLKAKADVKAVILWNDINHRKLFIDAQDPSAANLIQALHQADVILPTWESVKDGFLGNFPYFESKTRRMSWGTDMEMLLGEKAGITESSRQESSDPPGSTTPRLFWPRTIRENIRHDVLIDALALLQDRDCPLESYLVMGRAGNDPWCSKILQQLDAYQGTGLTTVHDRHIPLPQLHQHYNDSHLMVNLADSDQLSTCIVEAFLFNLDVILSDIASYRALVDMGFSATLVKNDPLEVSKAIQHVLRERCTPQAQRSREKNRKLALEVFDLETNLSGILEYFLSLKHRKRKSLLYMAPGSPPFGGVADQSEMLMRSHALNNEFKVVPLRTNPTRASEDPSAVRLISILHIFSLLRNAFSSRQANSPDLIQLVANGDASFIRDMAVALALKARFKSKLAVHLHCSRRGFWHRRSVPIPGDHPDQSILISAVAKCGYSLCRLLLKGADSLSYLTHEIADYYRELGFPSARRIIPNAVLHRSEEFHPGEQGSLLYVGRLSREKGFFDLLEALIPLTDVEWTLDVLGGHPSAESQKITSAFLAEHRLSDRVKLHGVVSGDDKWQYYRKASVFILPTHIDVLPVVILEAMAFGCAVITSDIGEIKGISGANHFSILKAGDIRGLTGAISGYLKDKDCCIYAGGKNYENSRTYQLAETSIIFTDNLRSLIAEESVV